MSSSNRYPASLLDFMNENPDSNDEGSSDSPVKKAARPTQKATTRRRAAAKPRDPIADELAEITAKSNEM